MPILSLFAPENHLTLEMERISVFDIFKIGIGPSSSHTMGPWRAAQRFVKEIKEKGLLPQLQSVQVELYGSLAKTGKGHGTDIAVLLGLNGDDPVTIPVEDVEKNFNTITQTNTINIGAVHKIAFSPAKDVVFFMNQGLPYHANGLIFRAFYQDGTGESQTYYSIGGGFVLKEGEQNQSSNVMLPCPIDRGDELADWCRQTGKNVSEVVFFNELTWRTADKIKQDLQTIWSVMKNCIYKGCHTDGILPGGLELERRAMAMNMGLMQAKHYINVDEWIAQISRGSQSFQKI
jgi:L-serine dehydratase